MDVLGEEGVQYALLVSAIVVLLVAAVGALPPIAARYRPIPFGGVALLAGAAAGLDRSDRIPDEALIGLLVFAVGLLLARLATRLFPAWMALAAPGAVLVGASVENPAEDWHVVVASAAAAVGAGVLGLVDLRARRPPVGPLLLAVATGGVFLTVPDTEHARVVAAAAVPLLVLSAPPGLARVGAPFVGAAVGLLGWIVAVEGAGRDGSVVGAAACLVAVLLGPLAGWIARRPTPPLAFVVVHIGAVLFCSRVAGRSTDAQDATVLAVIGLVVALAVLVGLVRYDAYRMAGTPTGAGAPPLR